MNNRLKRLAAISRKEFLHIIHDVRSLIIIFVIPVLMLTLFGYALNMEIQDIDLAVIDHDRTPQSRELIRSFEGNDIYNLFYYDGRMSEMQKLFLTRTARAILVIDKSFAENLERDGQAKVNMLVDAADPNAAMMIRNYSNIVISNYNQASGYTVTLPFDIRHRIWYNPDMKSGYFFVPGLIALILVMISALLTSITITREKEMGTMEQILVSPVRPFEIVLGKVLPYILMAFLDGLLILVLGMIMFGVPFTGSYLLLLLLTTLYVTAALSLGLLISTVVSTQQVAMMIAVAATLLPTVMLSGFIFPLKSMPVVIQAVSYIVPAKYYMVIIRGIMLKANTITQLLTQMGVLLLMVVVWLRVALKKFNLNLES